MAKPYFIACGHTWPCDAEEKKNNPGHNTHFCSLEKGHNTGGHIVHECAYCPATQYKGKA